MHKYYPLILGLMDTINDWNDKLGAFSEEHLDNVFVGTCILGVLIFVSFMGIQTLNKK